MQDILDLFDRQIKFVQQQTRERAFVCLYRLVAFMRRESRLSAVCGDIRREFQRASTAFAKSDAELLTKLRAEWARHGTAVAAAWETKRQADPEAPWVKFASPDTLRQQLEKTGDHSLPEFAERYVDGSATGAALRSLEHIRLCVAGPDEPQTALQVFFAAVTDVAALHQQALWGLWTAYGSQAGPALARLENLADAIVPRPFPESGSSIEQGAWHAPAIVGQRIRDAVLGKKQDSHDDQRIDTISKQMMLDLESIGREVALRFGLHRSREGLVRRFKNRCERFDATRLRGLVEKKRGRAEEVLTLVAAEFLFDQGFNPLFNAPIVTLRPDLFAPSPGHDFYVEAKQYASRRDLGASGATISKAIWQVWDTWNELDGAHDVQEAFLLVFRRGGPLLVFDEHLVQHQGRTLHPVVIDIAPTTTRGSRANEGPVHVSLHSRK